VCYPTVCQKAEESNLTMLKAEQGIIQFYFIKIPLHQQNFLLVSAFFNGCGCRDIGKKCLK